MHSSRPAEGQNAGSVLSSTLTLGLLQGCPLTGSNRHLINAVASGFRSSLNASGESEAG
jgi:hypothetical protein